jgi:prevent-host-death family protein
MQVSVAAAKRRLAELIRAMEAGEEVLITRNGRPVAQLRPVRAEEKKIRWGAMRGKIRMGEGWDAPIEIDDFLKGKF